MRLNLMTELKRLNLGVAEVEEFNLGLHEKFKSNSFKNSSEMHDRKVIQSAMDVKMHDETEFNRELEHEKNKWRKKIGEVHVVNSRTYRRILRDLRGEAGSVKKEYKDKYEKKLNHLRCKYRESEESKLDKVPIELDDFKDLSVFSAEKFDNIEIQKYEIRCIGDLHLTPEEQSVLQLHPKFSVIENLYEGGLAYEQELAYAKIRMQLRKEMDEEPEDGDAQVIDTEDVQEKQDELEAQSRQTFDPVNKIYNDRKRRVTDLDECTRITLPKPLPTKEEALIEMRREIHTRIYDEYRQEFCKKTGEQKPNLSESQVTCLRSLQKKIREGDIVVMKTDKSGKFCVTTRQEYIKMGATHIKNDRKITREELRYRDRLMATLLLGARCGRQEQIMDRKAG